MEFYRSSSVGNALIQSLNELLANNELTNEEAIEVLKVFDEKFALLLRDTVTIDKFSMKHEAKGTLSSYNNYEDLWKIDLDDLEVRFGGSADTLPPLKYQRGRLLFGNPLPVANSTSTGNNSK